MMNYKCFSIIFLFHFVFSHQVDSQKSANYLLTKGENNVSIITMGEARSAQCTVIEYDDFVVVVEVPKIPQMVTSADDFDKQNPLVEFIDSAFSNKPIKYVLNSHHHSHSLSTIVPFLKTGAQLITAQENVEIYHERGLLENEEMINYSESIIHVSADTVLLAETGNPIQVLYLKKSDYKSIPTESFLFFNWPQQKLLAASCMVYLKDYNEKYGFKGLVYSNRLRDVSQIIKDKKLEVDRLLQLFKLRLKDGNNMPPIFPITYFENVLKHSWHRTEISEHFQNMSYETLTLKKDSILNYLGENDIYHIVLNHAVYALIGKKEYQKAVALAHILVVYEPNRLNEIDTLGEAYYNNGQLDMAKHYDGILKRSNKNTDDLGWAVWKTNREERLQKES